MPLPWHATLGTAAHACRVTGSGLLVRCLHWSLSGLPKCCWPWMSLGYKQHPLCLHKWAAHSHPFGNCTKESQLSALYALYKQVRDMEGNLAYNCQGWQEYRSLHAP